MLTGGTNRISGERLMPPPEPCPGHRTDWEHARRIRDRRTMFRLR